MIKIYRHFVPTRTCALIVLDLLLLSLFLVGFAESVIQHADGTIAHAANSRLPALSLALVLTTALSGLAAGLYREEISDGLRARFATAAVAGILALVSGGLVIAGFRAIGNPGGMSVWQWAVILLLLWPLCLVLTRTGARAASRHDLFRRRILLIGDGETATQIENFIRSRGSSLCIARRFAPASITRTDTGELTAARLKAEGIREVVVAIDDKRGMPMSQLMSWKLDGISIVDHLTFWEREAGEVHLSRLQPAWFVYGEGCRRTILGRAAKRAVDLFGSLLLLVVTSPVIALFAALIRIESRGPIFYRQMRTGRHGKPFMLLKFRSMTVDAEQDTPRWAATHDPRVTRVGKFMRMMRIDELPQLINIIRADMSLIGPRPERPYFVEQLSKDIPFYRERHCVRPGLTGWAQVNYPYGASIEDAERKLAYDLYYVKNQSFLLDLYIMISTIRVVLFQEGAR
jgi:sugar transferase (PEP-CTERM system associated)